MFKFRDISADTVAFPWANGTPRRGLQSTLAIAIALLVGHWTGHSSAGAIAAGAAFTVGFAVFHEAMESTLLSMGLLTIGIASAALVGSYAAEWTWAAVIVVIVASANYGLLAELGPTPGWIGQQGGVFAIIASGFPGGVRYAEGRASMVLLGGALQMLVFAATYRFYRRSKIERAIHPEPFPERFRNRTQELWAGLRAAVRQVHTGATLSYIFRLSITLVAATLYYRRHHLPNGYWAPMTAILVLRPEWSGTMSRGTARLLGTVAGATLVVLNALYLPLNLWVVFALVLIAAWATYAVQAVNYALFAFFLTLYIVYSFRFGGFSQPAAAHFRVLNTSIGGGIAMLVDALWLIFHWLKKRKHPNALISDPFA
jgi:hypothetical protein